MNEGANKEKEKGQSWCIAGLVAWRSGSAFHPITKLLYAEQG